MGCHGLTLVSYFEAFVLQAVAKTKTNLKIFRTSYKSVKNMSESESPAGAGLHRVKSNKSRLDTINQEPEPSKKNMAKVHSHFLVPSEKLDKVTRRVIAPYAQIERKGLKEEKEKAGYLDINRFNVFLEETVDLESLLYETAMVLKTVTKSSGK